jgi:hypothetical protein
MGKASKGSSGSGQPRWTYVAGSVVGIAGLVWLIVSYFLPKPAQDKQSTLPASPNVQVSVTGSGSVGVGEMKGGKITVGAPSPMNTSESRKHDSSLTKE